MYSTDEEEEKEEDTLHSSRLVGLEHFTLIRPHIATRLSNQTTPFPPRNENLRKTMMMNRRLSPFSYFFFFFFKKKKQNIINCD